MSQSLLGNYIVNFAENSNDPNYSVIFAENSFEIVHGKVHDGVSCDAVDGKVHEIVGLRNAKLFLREPLVLPGVKMSRD